MQGEVASTSTKHRILATPVNPERSIYAHPRNINRSNFGFDISEFRAALFHVQSLQPILLFCDVFLELLEASFLGT
jgi:hypothetical protein